ncbi:hypothetical protein GCM10010174_50510 [Kutzneria viridogrisea]|uniref:Uncharacterized protein n=2 Tax=Kutzneria TaxID=43356 RepID=W5WFD2_9PSEU|nr:hypothetical protein [Kutzneria albida]AHH99291.1 hypothetical protein KALB_5930 [Kutzneria albida DSM 43870]MBA8923155.1 hypothetical protein [Kutzneria viridogrisea]
MNSGYQVIPQELTTQASALAALGEQTTALVASAGRLAERLPQLGTAPPALHLAARLREAAGRSGLTGEVTAADTELSDCHQALRGTLATYLDTEAAIARSLRAPDGDPA